MLMPSIHRPHTAVVEPAYSFIGFFVFVLVLFVTMLVRAFGKWRDSKKDDGAVPGQQTGAPNREHNHRRQRRNSTDTLPPYPQLPPPYEMETLSPPPPAHIAESRGTLDRRVEG